MLRSSNPATPHPVLQWKWSPTSHDACTGSIFSIHGNLACEDVNLLLHNVSVRRGLDDCLFLDWNHCLGCLPLSLQQDRSCIHSSEEVLQGILDLLPWLWTLIGAHIHHILHCLHQLLWLLLLLLLWLLLLFLLLILSLLLLLLLSLLLLLAAHPSLLQKPLKVRL